MPEMWDFTQESRISLGVDGDFTLEHEDLTGEDWIQDDCRKNVLFVMSVLENHYFVHS